MTGQRCTYCGSTAHSAVHCPQTHAGQGNLRRMRCSYCGATTHFRDACPKTVAPHNRKPGRYIGGGNG